MGLKLRGRVIHVCTQFPVLRKGRGVQEEEGMQGRGEEREREEW